MLFIKCPAFNRTNVKKWRKTELFLFLEQLSVCFVTKVTTAARFKWITALCLCVLQWKARTASFDSQGSCPSPRPPASPWDELPVTQQPRRGFLPPPKQLPVCVLEEKQSQCLSLLPLSNPPPPSPHFLKSGARALPSTELGLCVCQLYKAQTSLNIAGVMAQI